ncbi:MAG TPA: fused MFS/spermidine synthase [Candidatus Hydrogenedentes bacterium]|nr:fused MFS/spermidine synthase [Candidatus Hydrogenedentota bacterium]
MESQEHVGETRCSAGPANAAGLTVALGICVLLSGAAVMIYEFLAVRILARYFGSSLGVWASVIAVLLAGLSAGYALGGLVADRFGSVWPLAAVLVVAGLTGAFTEKVAVAVGEGLLAVDVGLAWHPYLAAILVSFVPILALGTVLPQAIRIRAERTNRPGSAAGWIAALSTLGSILGVVLTVHVLLPRMGVRQALYATSSVLILAGGVLMLAGPVLRALRLKTRVPVLLALCLFGANARAQIVFEDYSAYHHIIVEDTRGERLLRFDNDVQSTMSLRDIYAGGFEYTEFFHVPLVLDPTITSALFVGLGGGTGPKAFLSDYPHLRVDVVEIDPMVVDIAETYFGLPPDPRLRVIVRDGRVQLQRGRQKYGAIIMDAYASGAYGPYVPYHLITQEFFQLAWGRLENGGSLVYNVVGAYGGEFDEMVRGVYSTLATTFQAVYAFKARSSLNTVFVAQKIDVADLQLDGTRDGYAWPHGPWLRHPLSGDELQGLAQTLTTDGFIKLPILHKRLRQFSPVLNSPPAGPIYTDNYAPVDVGPRGRIHGR